MTRPLKEIKYKASEKPLDSVLQVKLRQWITARPHLLESDVQVLLERMHEFARQIRAEGFAPALTKLASDTRRLPMAIDLTELIADRLCQGTDVNDGGIRRKSLQETLFLCTGIGPELAPSEFGKRLENFLAMSGSKGFLRVFLSEHLSNLIFTDLRDSLQASAPEELRSRTEAVERMCHQAAAAAVRRINDWSEPDGSLTASLLLDLEAEITKTSSNEISLHRGA